MCKRWRSSRVCEEWQAWNKYLPWPGCLKRRHHNGPVHHLVTGRRSPHQKNSESRWEYLYLVVPNSRLTWMKMIGVNKIEDISHGNIRASCIRWLWSNVDLGYCRNYLAHQSLLRKYPKTGPPCNASPSLTRTITIITAWSWHTFMHARAGIITENYVSQSLGAVG